MKSRSTKFCLICKKRLNTHNQINLCRLHRRATQEGREREKTYYLKYHRKNLERGRKYAKEHRTERSSYALRYIKERMKRDPLFKMRKRLQEYTSKALRKSGGRGRKRTIEILGADFFVVKEHLQRKFKKGMGWNNYGTWHIDHIIPMSSASCLEEALALCHYSNLQPLWAWENFQKSDKMPVEISKELIIK